MLLALVKQIDVISDKQIEIIFQYKDAYAEAEACFTGDIPKKQIEDAVLASIWFLTEALIEKDNQMREAKAMKPEVVSLNHMEQLRFLKKNMDSI